MVVRENFWIRMFNNNSMKKKTKKNKNRNTVYTLMSHETFVVCILKKST